VILSREDVERLALTKRMISPFVAERMGPCSYDLSVGKEFYTYQEEDGESFVSRSLSRKNPDARCRIPPNGCAFILSDETLNMPVDVVGQVALRFGMTKRGIMLSPQAPIDPGFNGRILMMLYNLSDKEVALKYGEAFVTVSFHQLSSETSGYAGDNQGVLHIDGYMPHHGPIKTSMASTETLLKQQSALLKQESENLTRQLGEQARKLDERLADESKKLDDRLGQMQASMTSRSTSLLGFIGVILAVATLVAALLAVYTTYSGARAVNTPQNAPSSSQLSKDALKSEAPPHA